VAPTLKPTSDSDIKIEVWMPAARWNQKFQAVGNGGWAGNISYPALGLALSQGYAVASTDTGHTGNSASFALGHPEKLVDFGHRAVHEMTIKAKAIIEAFYSNAPARSYWNGCSTGGRQGLMEAQRYPADFDGIVVGAPANYMSHLQPWSLWIALATHAEEASFIPPAKYAIIHKAVLDACDALDGVKDNVIEDPGRCHFDPKSLECTGADTSACLIAPQIEAARKIYRPATSPHTGLQVFPSLEPGSELGWGGFAGAQPFAISTDFYKFVVYRDPNWDWRTLDLDRDVVPAENAMRGDVDATNPDLREFLSRGGKLLMYHGWNDQLIAPRNSIEYFEAALYTMGVSKISESIRLFMVPGMAHCTGGEGTSNFDMTTELDRWVTSGVAPDRIIASRPASSDSPARTRPLCPYPQIAQYKGSGSTDDASNFACNAR
jgi:feruloyl esterase